MTSTVECRLTAKVLMDGHMFTTEPVFAPTIEIAVENIMTFCCDMGWEFVCWNDLCEIKMTVGFMSQKSYDVKEIDVNTI